MAKTTEQDRLKEWRSRIAGSEKAWRAWASRYKPDVLEDYYYGHQWELQPEDKEPYVINKFYSAIESRQPALMFYRPQVHVRPKPWKLEDVAAGVEDRAKIQQDLLQTFMDDGEVGFTAETRMAAFEAFFSYGVIEVGYTSDFIDNPRAGKPMLNEKGDELRDSKSQPVIEPDMLVDTERLYLKHIPARQFRVPVNAAPGGLHRVDWYGYYEWHWPSDVQKNKAYKNTGMVKASGAIKQEYADEAGLNEEMDTASDTGIKRYRGMVKVWKVWDLREKIRRVFADGMGDKFLQEQPMDIMPNGRPLIQHAVLKMTPRLNEWLPLPFVYNWKHPQDEINETRDQQRNHRRRFERKFALRRGSVTEDEAKKLENGGDGTMVWVEGENAVLPIADAPLDSSLIRNIILTKDDFNEASGVTGEQRGLSEADTATQAQLLDMNSRMRSHMERQKVAEWLADICKIMLQLARLRMALPIWIKSEADQASLAVNGSGNPMEMMRVATQWRQIAAADMGDIDFDVTIDVESMTPKSEASERNEWIEFLKLILNPGVMSMLAAVPSVLRRTLHIFNVRSESEVQEIMTLGRTLLAAQAQAEAAGLGGGPPGQGSAPQGRRQGVGPGPTPNQGDIGGQLKQQGPTFTPFGGPPQ